MPKQRSVGITLFLVCLALYARTAIFAPTERESKMPLIAKQTQAYGGKGDSLGVLHGVRYYILGIGVLGLLLALEDFFLERSPGKKRADPDTQPSGDPP